MVRRRLVVSALSALACASTVSPPPLSAPKAPELRALEHAGPPAEAVRAPEPPAPPALPAARRFVATQRELARFSAGEVLEPSYDLTVPAPARPLLKELKRRGGELIHERLGALLAEGTEEGQLGERTFEAFRQAGAVTEYDAQSFGALPGVAVERVDGHENLYAAVLPLVLPCGSDSTLFLMRRNGDELEAVLTAAADDYVSIADGQLALGYAVSPPEANGDFHVLTAHTTPWCSSAWRRLSYRVVSPTGDPERPRLLLQGSSDVWIGDRVAKLGASRDRVEIEFDSWDRLGTNVMRPVARAYELHGASFRPAALALEDPEHVPNAWLALEWDLAQALVHAPARARLRTLHARYRAAVSAESGAVEIERRTSSRALVRFACDDCQNLPKLARFVLVRARGRWLVSDVLEARR